MPRYTLAPWLLASLFLFACGGDDADDAADAGATPEVTESSDYLDSVPSGDELTLELTDADGQALTASEFALEDGARARVRDITLAVFERVNTIVHESYDRVRLAVEDVEPETLEIEGFNCKRWLKTIEGVDWRLRACRRDKALRLYGFLLEGRPEGGADADFVPVFAGEGVVRPRFDGKKRGAGRVGYNLDNFNALTGNGPTGKIGVGYRAVGRVRQLNVGLKGFTRDGEEPINALYRYRQLIGVGGKVTLTARADLIAEDENGDLIQGEDGLVERNRVSLGWLRDKGGRAAVVHCDGTLGEGQCIRRSQCWRKEGELTQDETGEVTDAPSFTPAHCPMADVDPVPGEDELPADGGEEFLGAPDVGEPAADPEEEEA